MILLDHISLAYDIVLIKSSLVEVNDFAFGRPTKYWRVRVPGLTVSEWDDAIATSSMYFRQTQDVCVELTFWC